MYSCQSNSECLAEFAGVSNSSTEDSSVFPQFFCNPCHSKLKRAKKASEDGVPFHSIVPVTTRGKLSSRFKVSKINVNNNNNNNNNNNINNMNEKKEEERWTNPTLPYLNCSHQKLREERKSPLNPLILINHPNPPLYHFIL